MFIGTFARPNSNPQVRNSTQVVRDCERCQARNHARKTRDLAAARIRRLLLAETINDSGGAAVIALAGAAVTGSVNLAEIGVLVVQLQQADGPALLEFNVEAASGHPAAGPAPMTVRIKTALACQVVTGKGRSDHYLSERRYLVPVAQRINSRAQLQAIELRIPICAVDVVNPGKIGARAQPAENAIVRVHRKPVHIQPVTIGLQQRRVQIAAAK